MGLQKLLANIISLIRFDADESNILEPFSETVCVHSYGKRKDDDWGYEGVKEYLDISKMTNESATIVQRLWNYCNVYGMTA